MSNGLLPSLRQSTMKGGAVVLTVLSGGEHTPYKNYKMDPELKLNYNVKNAADFAGFYTDLGFDYMARQPANKHINFVHASPGFVNTNWGTEMPWYVRKVVRLLQPLGRKASDCAEFMTCPTVLASDAGEALPTRPDERGEGIYIIGENGEPKKLTSLHSADAREFVWTATTDVLGRAGIQLN